MDLFPRRQCEKKKHQQQRNRVQKNLIWKQFEKFEYWKKGFKERNKNQTKDWWKSGSYQNVMNVKRSKSSWFVANSKFEHRETVREIPRNYAKFGWKSGSYLKCCSCKTAKNKFSIF